MWITALRSGSGREATHLRGLLDSDEVGLAAPVWIEILSGASNRDRARLRGLLSALPLAFPSDATWTRIHDWLDPAGRAGERFGFADLLIAGIAAEKNASIWSLDDDFRRMARLGLVSVHEP